MSSSFAPRNAASASSLSADARSASHGNWESMAGSISTLAFLAAGALGTGSLSPELKEERNSCSPMGSECVAMPKGGLEPTCCHTRMSSSFAPRNAASASWYRPWRTLKVNGRQESHSSSKSSYPSESSTGRESLDTWRVRKCAARGFWVANKKA